MVQGVIIKALSGFYYVAAGDQIVECKARGRFRYDGCSPLVGDRVEVSFDAHGKGRIDTVLPRRNAFIRPAVANIDQLIMIAANVNPVTDPFLIDRVVAIAENADCEPVVCLNKCDLDPADHLYAIYRSIGFRVLRTSAATGLGVDELRDALRGKTSAFTGNSGVGKSSILNALDPTFALATGEISDVIEADGKYYILRCVNDYDEAATKARKEEMVREKRNEVFYETYSEYAAKVHLAKDDSLWKNLSITDGERTSADFFEIFETVCKGTDS